MKSANWFLRIMPLLLLAVQASAQWGTLSGHHCQADEQHQLELERNPVYRRSREALEAFTRSFQENPLQFRSPEGNKYIIPVVFHIVHNGGTENISRAQIHDALAELNEDFQFRNADTAFIPKPFRQVAANMEIEFRLARKDPQGQCSEGIVRVQSDISEFYTDDIPGRQLTELSYWPPERYLNIWVVKTTNRGDLLLGAWATYPGRAPESDGIVIPAGTLGRIELGAHPITSSPHLLTHEVGHWLNLLHPWGGNDPSNDCIDRDSVADTPPQPRPNYECPDFPSRSCNRPPFGDMFNNFMDYSSCTNMFTRGQRNRVYAALQWDAGGRNRIWTAENLRFTGVDEASFAGNAVCAIPPKADFSMGDKERLYIRNTIYCAGMEVPFQELSWGSPATSWQWTFEGGWPARSNEPNPRVRFSRSGRYLVRLVASNAYGADTLEREVEIIMMPDQAIYRKGAKLREDFESPGVDSTLASMVIDGVYRWQLVEVDHAPSGRRVMRLDDSAVDPDKGNSQLLLTSAFDLSDLSEPRLSFQLSYTAPVEPLEFFDIVAFIDCNIERPTLLATFDQAELLTGEYDENAAGPAPGSWKKFEIQIPESLRGKSNVRFGFHWVSEPTNNGKLYLDDVAIEHETATSIVRPIEKFDLQLAPNPANDLVRIQLSDEASLPAPFRIFDARGQQLRTGLLQQQVQEIEIATLAPGMYLVQVGLGAAAAARRLLVKH